MEKGLLNFGNLNELLLRIDSRHRYGLKETHSREEFRFFNCYQNLIEKILKTFYPKNNQTTENIIPQIKKLGGREVLSFRGLEKNKTDSLKTNPLNCKEIIDDLAPWRKGPYDFFSHTIESEWDSSIKWNRLLPYLQNILSSDREEIIADLGCNNGYFMFRWLAKNSGLPDNPNRWVVGFEPVYRNALQYFFLNSRTCSPQLIFLLLGYEALYYFPKTFGVILCLGILYHHPDPLGILKLIGKSLKKGGNVIIDCQGISGEEPTIFFPRRRYTGKRNFWFLPTINALQYWLERTGFKDITVWGKYPLEVEEQRRTCHSSGESLAEGLSNPESYYEKDILNSRTVEGYPSPLRLYVSASK